MPETHGTHCRGERTKAKGYGPTSLWLHEPEALIDQLNLSQGMVLLDAGCGAGEYSLLAAPQVGDKGQIIALDTISLSIEELATTSKKEGLTNIRGHVCDITGHLPLTSRSVDLILLSTVLHIRAVRDRASDMFHEFRRVLRPEGKVAVIECKKEEADFGPPLHSRLAPNEVEAIAASSGLKKTSLVFFEHTYMLNLA
ncbi:SAM-dependent methyltransferase [Pseudodesulfovibrio nedwellii]|uniref:SAM-dependent methyltransferase n=1 Tax=Pseudodesulfovibrio nedwellii TaxID=2973072 RepID=A0ABM8B0C7_9BACT|nr:class I SAM-dependent methyltransferase [Pseudodesulfovibrio nedwellii]BDQ37251.1 SAM-dependent methyltransferase [Pseudodesulfovibrio nedwellii]